MDATYARTMTQTPRTPSELVAWERDHLSDLSLGYPANHFAWRVVLDHARAAGARSLVEVGVGRGNGVAHVLDAGMSFAGIDRDAESVERTQAILDELGADPSAVVLGDIEHEGVAQGVPGAGDFDTLMALGIMPHAEDPVVAVRAMESLVRPGGELFLEYRNSLFSLVTFNRLSRQFIVDELLGPVGAETRERTGRFVDEHVDLTRPPVRSGSVEARYDNPLAIGDWFAGLGFREVSVHPFHYHASMPVLESEDPQAFRDESLALESDTSGWRGLFLCSVFLVRAVRPT